MGYYLEYSALVKVFESLKQEHEVLKVKYNELKLSNQELQSRYNGLLEEYLGDMMDAVSQACTKSDGTLSSNGLSTWAYSMRFLEKHGKIIITSEYGRVVNGVWV